MKRGTSSSPKFRRLCRRLDKSACTVAGALELLWHFTASNAPRGDVGRWSNQDIAEGAGWEEDPDALITALIAERWLDENTDHRLIVHDWSEHADDAVHRALARRGELFANGARPSTSRLYSKEKASAEQKLTAAETGARQAHRRRTPGARKALSPAPPEPRQSQSPAPPVVTTSGTGIETDCSERTAPAEEAIGAIENSENRRPETAGALPNGSGELAASVLVLAKKAGLDIPAEDGSLMPALLEACVRHPRIVDWEYVLLDRMKTQKNPETGGPVQLSWLVAAEIRSREHRQMFAEERWGKVARRFYGPE